MKRSVLVEGNGIPLGRVLARAQRHDSPLLGPTLDLLGDLGPLPDEITVDLDAGYDSGKTRQTLADRGLRGQIAHKGEKAPIQASERWHVERTKCAARRPAVSPVQPGGTWREVPGHLQPGGCRHAVGALRRVVRPAAPVPDTRTGLPRVKSSGRRQA
jgi:Transposase DDE domain